jgi:hypothetical protein
MSQTNFTPELIAPCGMNCGICKAYLAYTNEAPRIRGKVTYCSGCLPRAKNCYIKRGCKNLSKHTFLSCSECDTLPCEKLARLDKRYRERYGMSMVENLKMLREKGMEDFLQSQAQKYSCPTCGTGVISVHDRKCYGCGYKRKV